MDDRRIRIATLASVLAHLVVLSIPIKDRPLPPSPMGAEPAGSLTVDLVAEAPAEPASKSAPAEPAKPPQILAARPKTPVPQGPRVLESLPPVPAPAPTPTPMPTFDMAAMIAATRERRRAFEGASRAAARPPPVEDAGAVGLARNLQSLSPTGGTGGVFQVLRKGERTGEFAFNGWQGDARRWREVIEVDAGPGGDVELAIVRGMIRLIRTHYTGDFNWESHLRGRILVLSARLEDNAELEDFMRREFFGTPVLRPAR
jgi:hypothetical protein